MPTAKKKKSSSWTPHPKVATTVGIGAPLAVILNWTAYQVGLYPPDDVVIAASFLLAGFIGWLTPLAHNDEE